jgi:uncharacterized FAD-dependent dehydrogenase
MPHTLTLQITPEEEADELLLKRIVAEKITLPTESITAIRNLKRSIDARSRAVKIHLQLEVYLDEVPLPTEYRFEVPNVATATRVIIIGAGPAGLFAALRLIKGGFKPIILERGSDAKARRRDLAAINRQHIVHPDSNYCFGEGGAGTYSDGKLYTRSTKRGDVRSVLELLVAHGASDDILVEAHPHIGTNKLPQIIMNIRQSILNAGGEVHFNTRVTDFLLHNNSAHGASAQSVSVQGVATADGREFLAARVILATGHSARDIFEILAAKKVRLEAKSFAMGLRIEHPQALIDAMQYRSPKRHPLLPPAAYSWVEQTGGGRRGVFSFCMCPGGIIAPCATSAGEVVTNGWSPSKRNNPFANSGVVVAINAPEDLLPFQAEYGARAGVKFQQELEQMAFEAGGRTQTAPAQRLVDFVENRLSGSLPETSYQPGIVSAPLHELLPPIIGQSLQEAFRAVAKKMKPYYTNEAVLHGVESRTSSPVRIPRDATTLEHPDVRGLYPCGEGAGFAGGIVSAAIDGQKCAAAIIAGV